MPDIDNATLAALATNAGNLFQAADALRQANYKTFGGTIDDPDSFDAEGRPSTDPDHGPLGFYPLTDGSGGTVYFPCWDRMMILAGAEVGEAVLDTAQAFADAAQASAVAADGSADAAAASKSAADADAAAAAADRTAVHADKLAADADAAATAADRVQTGLDRTAAAGSATAASGSAGTATTQAGIATTKAGEASSHKDAAYGYAQTAAAAVAYQNLSAIATSKAFTASDLLVYDTSKDSDGGAWRKRCQHTSWYNETLNTSKRGARREFPAVALLFLANQALYIYDGDDPSLPMWMIFDANYSGMLAAGGGYNVTSIDARNGIIALGSPSAALAGLSVIDFIADRGRHYGQVANAATGTNRYAGAIVDRNAVLGNVLDASLPNVVSLQVNDIAMTVLPDAPIDPATQLPTPTIAIATGAGVTILNNDGTSANWVPASSGICYRVSAEPNMLLVGGGGGIGHKVWGRTTYPATNTSAVDFTINESSIPSRQGTDGASGSSQQGIVNKRNGTVAISTQRGLCLLAPNAASMAGSMVAYLASTYSSGWMVGDIRGAWFATKNTGTIGTELIVNGGFDSDTVWVKGQTGLATTTIASGKLTLVSPNGDNCNVQQSVLTAGRAYLITGTATIRSGSIKVAVGNSVETAISATGDFSFYATADSSFFAVVRNAACDADVDNISVREVVVDRSVKANPLKVVGTVSVAAVASGADLCSFSGFSGANYLEQAYSANLDFATDFSIMGWVYKTTTSHDRLLERADYNGAYTGAYLRLYLFNNIVTLVLADTAASSQNFAPATAIGVDVWTHFVALRRGATVEIYYNGALVYSGAAGGDADGSLANANAKLRIGNTMYDGAVGAPNSKLALMRISATAPTAAQIKKIYSDERPLFLSDAAGTIYGASDVISALAEDKDTELLHVGTSAGRSVFQGLRRVGNTTDAVGVAISAANNLVVDD